jgi:hypothetical protein
MAQNIKVAGLIPIIMHTRPEGIPDESGRLASYSGHENGMEQIRPGPLNTQQGPKIEDQRPSGLLKRLIYVKQGKKSKKLGLVNRWILRG